MRGKPHMHARYIAQLWHYQCHKNTKGTYVPVLVSGKGKVHLLMAVIHCNWQTTAK